MPTGSPKYLFQPGDESNQLLLEWWHGLGQDKGERARLRRSSNPTEVIFSWAYHRFLNSLLSKGYRPNRETLAAVVGLTARVKEHLETASLAKQMASPKPGATGARVSGLRFRRLLAATQCDELFEMLIRVIQLLDGRVNLFSLANAVYWWNENTRKQWAYEYYSTAPSEK